MTAVNLHANLNPDYLETLIRQPWLVDSRRWTVIVSGGYYIFGEAPDSVEVSRLIRDFNINSRADLDDYLMENPTMVGN